MFTYDDMKKVKIPVPNILIQKSIAEIYGVFMDRRKINEKLKTQIKDICPILVKGAIDEGI